MCAPWETLPLSFIAQNDIHAAIEHEKLLADTPALDFYTDGSGIDENIGAAAVNLVSEQLDDATLAKCRIIRYTVESWGV